MTEEERDTVRHLGVMIEGLRSDTRLVAEGVSMTNERLARLEDEMTGEFKAVRAEMARGFKAVRTEMARGFAEVRAEADAFRAETAQSFAGVRAEADAFRAETAQNFAGVQAQVAGTYSDVDRRLRAVENR